MFVHSSQIPQSACSYHFGPNCAIVHSTRDIPNWTFPRSGTSMKVLGLSTFLRRLFRCGEGVWHRHQIGRRGSIHAAPAPDDPTRTDVLVRFQTISLRASISDLIWYAVPKYMATVLHDLVIARRRSRIATAGPHPACMVSLIFRMPNRRRAFAQKCVR